MMQHTRGPTYLQGRLKRGFDLAVSLVALVTLSPIFVILALLVLLSSGTPIFFSQKRIGRHGFPFRLFKFRTMHPGSDRGLPITASGDPRVTPVGHVLRATKLDELPQFINVLKGEMSLVGPRPEVPRYVLAYSPEQRRVLEARPGLTDPASVLFVEEERLLGSVAEDRRERYYIEEVLPKKLKMNLEYIERAGFWYDVTLILRTLKAILSHERP
jgi:lipopolysaccharide/colanic/teichoic acid biosynthesis glycosyltransferase